jgi:hypothetical protein
LVPLEGHWERVNTPLRKTTLRERRLLVGFGALLAFGVIAATIVAIATNGPETGKGCIRVDLPSTMGGSTPELCGSAARSFCAGPASHQAPLSSTALPKCREAGIPVEAD